MISVSIIMIWVLITMTSVSITMILTFSFTIWIIDYLYLITKIYSMPSITILSIDSYALSIIGVVVSWVID